MSPVATERLRIWPRSRFGSDDFSPSRDQFKDAIVLPRRVFDRLFEAAETGYVSVSTPGRSESLLVYALQFGPGADPDDSDASDGELPDAYLRSGLREQLAVDEAETAPVVEVEPVPLPDSGPLDIVRFSTKTESTRPGECRANPTVLDRIEVSDGDEVELYNPETGGRLSATMRAEQRSLADGEISLSTRGRKLLQVEMADRADPDQTSTLHARRPPARAREGLPTDSPLQRVRRRLLDWLVDYHEIRLRVVLGLNADEGRSTARVNEDTMDVLAIEDGDRVVVTSRVGSTAVRCRQVDPTGHHIETDADISAEDVEDRTILLPSTARSDAGALCDDVVTVRRDTGHVAARQIVPSLFGFLGVFVGAVQSIELLVPPGWQLAAFGVAVVLSLTAVWFVLWPERQRCR